MTTPFLHSLRISLTAAATIFLAACDGKGDAAGKGKPPAQPPVPVQTGLAVRKDIPVDLRAVGNVEPISSVAIMAQVGGELIGVSFEEGQDVKKGDLLFSIQPRLYATKLAEAQANLARDRAQAASAKREVQRQEELDAKGAGIKEDLDRARALAEAAEATVKADEALVLIAETQVGYSTIESPIDGRTGAIRVRPGNLIRLTDDDPLTTVVQLAPIYVAFTVPEQHLTAIRTAMEKRTLKVTAHEPRTGAKLGDGDLGFVANMVDTATGSITLKATFPNKDHALWPGAFVDVLLHLDTDSGAVVVPSSAVSRSQNGAILYVVKADATADLRRVKTGRTVGEQTVIIEGVAEGEKVITNGQSRLLPGFKVIEKQLGPGTAPEAGRDGTAKPATEFRSGTGSGKSAALQNQTPGLKRAHRAMSRFAASYGSVFGQGVAGFWGGGGRLPGSGWQLSGAGVEGFRGRGGRLPGRGWQVDTASVAAFRGLGGSLSGSGRNFAGGAPAVFRCGSYTSGGKADAPVGPRLDGLRERSASLAGIVQTECGTAFSTMRGGRA